MWHKAGCPTYSAMSFVNFMTRNAWIAAIILTVLGFGMGIFGIRFFEYVSATCAGMLMFFLFMTLATLWQRVMYTARDQPVEWSSSGSFVISFLFAVALALATA